MSFAPSYPAEATAPEAGVLQELQPPQESRALKGVVVGGGSGAPLSIRTLLSLGVETSAVVAMADDGGSTGILRERAGMIPPGDIRNCLACMAADEQSSLAKAFRFRFDYAQNHPLGNLLLTALTEVTGSFPQAIKTCEDLLHCRGHVYPSTLENIYLNGKTQDGRKIYGESPMSDAMCALHHVWLEPENPQVFEPAAHALEEADVIILGPGSLFTSVIPNLLVPGIREAIHRSHAITVFVCSMADVQRETWGLNAFEHVEALLDHGMSGRLDVVLLNRDSEVPSHKGFTTVHPSAEAARAGAFDPAIAPTLESRAEKPVRPVKVDDDIIHAIEALGPNVMARKFSDPRYPTWHSPDAFREAIEGVLRACRSRLK